jgi:DNA-binding beta-propeller fold protein YncE
MSTATFATFLMLGALGASPARAAEPAPLVLESQISLGAIRGRIDHLAIDIARERLYVAELGNDSLGVVDLKARRTIRTLSGFSEPQGVAYSSATDTLFVANAGDGTVRLFRGDDLIAVGVIPLGRDADNVRVDDTANRLFVGYGDGALAVINTKTRTRLTDIPLNGHPESFQLTPTGERIFVNVPDAREIAVFDRVAGRQFENWPTGDLRENFPLALDSLKSRVLAIFRQPSRIGIFDDRDGRIIASLATCSDSDDLFVDPVRHQLYVVCGEGFVDVFKERGESYERIAHMPTAPGARTGLYVPQRDQLFVAVRASATKPASISVYRPGPSASVSSP